MFWVLKVFLIFFIYINTAFSSEYQALFRPDYDTKPSFSECNKAILNGKLIKNDSKPKFNFYLYKSRIYTVQVDASALLCIRTKKLD